jgi:hypothetical protein
MKDISYVCLLSVVLFACNDLRISVGGRGVLTVSMYELFAYLLLILMAVYTLPSVGHYLFKTRHTLLFESPMRWLSLYLLWGLFAAVSFWGDPHYTIQVDYKQLLPAAIAFVGILLLTSDDPRKLTLIHGFWFTAGLINVAVALSQYFLSVPYFGRFSADASQKLDLTGDVATRLVVGFGTSHNQFAQILMPWFIVAVVVLVTRGRPTSAHSIAWLALSALFGFVLYATACKGALLWSLCGIAVGVAMTKFRMLRSSLLCMVLAGSIIAAINIAGGGHAPSFDSAIPSTVQSRIDLVVACMHLLLAHPLSAIIGGGLRYWDQYAYHYGSWQFYDAHSVYLNQILMYGIIGLILWSAFALSCMSRGLRKLDYPRGVLLSPFPYVGAVFGMAGEYWFEPSFKDALQKYQLLFVLAVLLVIEKSHRPTQIADAGGRRSKPGYRLVGRSGN